jgi:hypothetical protein
LRAQRKENEIFIRATLASNPNKEFAQRYSKTLEENLTTYDRERLLNGNWNARPKSGSEFLKEFNQEKQVKRDLSKTYDPNLALHVTFDENFNPYITCLILQVHQDGNLRRVRQIAEICLSPPNNTRKKVCQSIIDKFHGHRGGMIIYGDATSLKGDTAKEYGENFFTDIISYLQQFNPILRVPPKNPPVVSKGGFINLILEKDYRGISFEVDSECKKSIDDYSYAPEDSAGGVLKKRVTNPETGVSYEKYGHHIDALSYFICEAFQSDFDYYLSGGFQHDYVVGSDRDYRFER